MFVCISWIEVFQVAKESVIVDKQDASVQFNYLIPSNGIPIIPDRR